MRDKKNDYSRQESKAVLDEEVDAYLEPKIGIDYWFDDGDITLDEYMDIKYEGKKYAED